nr:hypothetical protein [Tanacetum cinerariifolium]
MSNSYGLVVFLVFITSMSSTFCDDGNQEIFMVVEDQTTMHDINAGTWMTKANPVQIGIFRLEDGKELKLSRKSSPGRNCVDLGQPCGLLDHCCDPYFCDGYFAGTCQTQFCLRAGFPCGGSPTMPCCGGPNACIEHICVVNT